MWDHTEFEYKGNQIFALDRLHAKLVKIIADLIDFDL